MFFLRHNEEIQNQTDVNPDFGTTEVNYLGCVSQSSHQRRIFHNYLNHTPWTTRITIPSLYIVQTGSNVWTLLATVIWIKARSNTVLRNPSISPFAFHQMKTNLNPNILFTLRQCQYSYTS